MRFMKFFYRNPNVIEKIHCIHGQKIINFGITIETKELESEFRR